MNFNFLLFAALLAFAFVTGEYLPSLKGMQELSIFCKNVDQETFVLQYEGNRDFDFIKISRFPPKNIQVLITEKQISDFKNQLDSRGIKYKIVIKNFQKMVDAESQAQKEAIKQTSSKQNNSYSFDYFPRHHVINEYLVEMSKKFEDVTVFKIGHSFEYREMKGVKISSGGDKKKPAILIDAGIHAREWIAPTTALFAISQLLEENNKRLYKNVDWYIIPSLNPDGYEFSHRNYRGWRKTRSYTRNSECVGVDSNRNFDFKWMEIGASNESCDYTYAGSKPFSEIENRNLRDFVLSKNGRIKIYLTLHSYGQYILYPWGYTYDLPENEPTLRKIGLQAAKAAEALYGNHYKVGSTTHLLYPAAGASDDWMMAIGGANLSYTIELPGNDFIVPAKKIKNIGLEIFKAFEVFAEYAEKTYS